jgi:D-hydroxyproline dehydrogenase subunit gamma
MPEQISVAVNGASITVAQGTTVAAALMIAGAPCRISVTGEPRAPLCGMGICFECRAEIDGIAHRRSCEIVCQPGMRIRTDV